MFLDVFRLNINLDVFRVLSATPRRNTGSDAESEKVDKVRSALDRPELHYAIGHMRRWDGAYPHLANGIKAVDLLQIDDKKARSVILA